LFDFEFIFEFNSFNDDENMSSLTSVAAAAGSQQVPDGEDTAGDDQYLAYLWQQYAVKVSYAWI